MKKSTQDVIDDINKDGLILTHAIAYVKMADPKAVYPRDCEGSFPQLALAFYRRHVDTDADPEFNTEQFRNLFNLLPDLFSFDEDTGTIVLHEIEDTHPLENTKIMRILRAFNYLDAESLGLRLFVYDRYGMNKRELDLPQLAIMVGAAK